MLWNHSNCKSAMRRNLSTLHCIFIRIQTYMLFQNLLFQNLFHVLLVDCSSASFKTSLSLNLKDFFINLPHIPWHIFNPPLLLSWMESGLMFCFCHPGLLSLYMPISDMEQYLFCPSHQNYQSQHPVPIHLLCACVCVCVCVCVFYLFIYL